MDNREHINPGAQAASSVARLSDVSENVVASGKYRAEAFGPVESYRQQYVDLNRRIFKVQDRLSKITGAPAIFVKALSSRLTALLDHRALIPMEIKWADDIQNVVTTEGKNALLSNHLKGSSFTQTAFLGLIESTGYGFSGANGSGVAATNIAASVTAAGGASPANGWNEATSAMAAARTAPTFGTASAGSLATSSAAAFSMLATCTIKGCFLMVKSATATAAVSTVGSTAGAIYSAGLFSGGDKSLQNGDTLNVTYTATA